MGLFCFCGFFDKCSISWDQVWNAIDYWICNIEFVTYQFISCLIVSGRRIESPRYLAPVYKVYL